MSDGESEARGWDAIDAALKPLYGDTEPHHVAPVLPAMLGGNDPLQGISAYRSTHGGTRHWHFVTYGFSELYEKETDDPQVSGYGFEMTVRVVDPKHVDEPPPWVFSLLQNLARYVFRSGNVFEPNHHTTLNGPIALVRDTKLVAAAFARDPELAEELATPNGKLQFVQLVGLTQDEYDAVRDWDTEKLLAVFREKNPALVTDLARGSYLDDAAVKQRAGDGAAQDGSSLATVYMTKGSFERAGDGFVLGIAANAVEDLKRFVLRRLELGRLTMLTTAGLVVAVEGADATAVVSAKDGFARLTLSAADRAALGELPVQRGDYPLPSGKGTLRILPIEIWDGQRKKVERVIG